MFRVINLYYILLDWIGFALEKIGGIGTSLRSKAMGHFGGDYWIDDKGATHV